MSTKPHTVQSTRLSESISALETRLLELQNKYDQRHADLKLAEAVCLKNLEEAANKQTTNAVDRIVKLFEFARNLLVTLIVVATVLGVGGYFQIQTFVKDFVAGQVKSWLNIAEPASPLHGPISHLTTRMAVNALIMDRARYGTRAGFHGNIKISSMWIDKMLADLTSASTSDGDFAELALALSSEAPLIGGGEHRVLIMDTIRKILLDPKAPAHRKAVLLRTFAFDPSLTEVAVDLFVNGKDLDTQAAAFRYLRRSITSERLAELARPILRSTPSNPNEDFLYLQQQAAETLADANLNDPDLAKFLATKKQEDHQVERALIGLAALDKISTKSAISMDQVSDAEKAKRISFAAPLLAAAINTGVSVTWSETAARTPVIALQNTDRARRRLYQIATPRALLAPGLGNALFNRLGGNTSGLVKLVAAVSGVPDFREEFGKPYRVELLLGPGDKLVTTTNEVLSQNRLGNPLYLESGSNDGTAVLIRWRDIDGLYKTAYLGQAVLAMPTIRIVPSSSASDRYLDNYAYNSRYD
ncbi:hypothetical protein [Massilia consociata]|uniref:HEAT repeat domain-containing protein n=1 Tax=Massilia consociata TaxID=760117 RepID=A0ABV6FMC8_9BURK